MHRRRPDGARTRRNRCGGRARELCEETGFSVAVEPLDFRYDLYRSEEAAEQWLELYGPGVDVFPEETFAAEVPFGPDPVITAEEHDAFSWCSFDEADALLKWEENRQALNVLRERLAD